MQASVYILFVLCLLLLVMYRREHSKHRETLARFKAAVERHAEFKEEVAQWVIRSHVKIRDGKARKAEGPQV